MTSVALTRPHRPASHSMRLLALAGLSLLLSACAGRVAPPPPRPAEPPRVPVQMPPAAPPRPVIQQVPRAKTPPVTQKTHPRYAPPPQGDYHWDNRLGVYVVKGNNLYYRERLYYRWNNGWYCAGRPDGPWETVAPPSVPPGLRTRHPAP